MRQLFYNKEHCDRSGSASIRSTRFAAFAFSS